MEDQELKKGNVDFLSSEEELFWKDLIDKYLYPLEATKKQTVKTQNI
jgi:chitin synthase